LSAAPGTTARGAEAKRARHEGQSDLSRVKSSPERAEARGRAHTSHYAEAKARAQCRIHGRRGRGEGSEAQGPVRLEQSQVTPREGGGQRPSTHVIQRVSEGMSAVQDTTAREAEAKGARHEGQSDLSRVKSSPERAEAEGRAHTSHYAEAKA
jgi:hypothetical protein